MAPPMRGKFRDIFFEGSDRGKLVMGGGSSMATGDPVDDECVLSPLERGFTRGGTR